MTRKLFRRLFVGGVWHGEVHEVDPKVESWVVPVVGSMLSRAVSYQPLTIGGPFGYMRVMVFSGIADAFFGTEESRQRAMGFVYDAIGKALEIEVRSEEES